MTPMDAQWLKKQFQLNPKNSKANLAKRLGLEPPAISKILNGTRQIKAQEYILMRDYFGLPNDGDNARGKENAYILKPLKHARELKDSGANSDQNWVMPANLLSQRTDAPSNKIKVFQIQENIMEPEFRFGENVLIDLSDNTPTPPGIFAVSDGFGTMIRHCELVASSKPPSIRVSANKQKFQPQILRLGEFKILGRVIAKLQWI